MCMERTMKTLRLQQVEHCYEGRRHSSSSFPHCSTSNIISKTNITCCRGAKTEKLKSSTANRSTRIGMVPLLAVLVLATAGGNKPHWLNVVAGAADAVSDATVISTTTELGSSASSSNGDISIENILQNIHPDKIEFAKRQLWWFSFDEDDDTEDNAVDDDKSLWGESNSTTLSGNITLEGKYKPSSTRRPATNTMIGGLGGSSSPGRPVSAHPKKKRISSKNTKSMRHQNQCARMIADHMPALSDLKTLTSSTTSNSTIEAEIASGSSQLLAARPLVTTTNVGSITPVAYCVNGQAETSNGPYPCKNTDLMSFISLRDLNALHGSPSDNANDMWGWVSDTGREFAIIGTLQATVFIEITNPTNPVIKGALPNINNNGQGTNSTWGDVKTFQNHAYIVTEAEDQGLQIFDLNQLLTPNDVKNTLFEETAHFNGFGNSHNIVINEDSGYAYAVGTDKCGGGMIIMDLNDNPLVPKKKACIRNADGTLYGWHSNENLRYVYTHDAHCVNYRGPDTSTVSPGTELCFACNEDRVVIFDMSNKNNVKAISTLAYHNSENTYTHQGWLTEDHKYFFFGDELDEFYSLGTLNTTTYLVDVQNLKQPTLIKSFHGDSFNIDHNLYIKEEYMYQANYHGGFDMFNISDVYNGVANIRRVAYFDIYPRNDAARYFNGAWSLYPWYPTGVVALSGIEEGFFVLQPNVEPTFDDDPSYELYNRATFENSNWGIWNDPGANARMETHDGEKAVRLYGNTWTSRTYTNSLDTSSPILRGWRVDIEISPRYMRNGHEVRIQVSDDGTASNWKTVRKFTKSTHHRNHGRYLIQQEIFKGTTYISNDASRVRFAIKFVGDVDYSVPIYEISLHKWEQTEQSDIPIS